MAASIRLADSAVMDLEALQQWYADHGAASVGRRLVDEILGRIEQLGDHPDSGRIVPEFGQPFLRELIHPPFRSVCRRDGSRVRVVHIWRNERPLKL